MRTFGFVEAAFPLVNLSSRPTTAASPSARSKECSSSKRRRGVKLRSAVLNAHDNGGVNVIVRTSWRVNVLDVTTTNCALSASLPGNYAAHIETGTVHGASEATRYPQCRTHDKTDYEDQRSDKRRGAFRVITTKAVPINSLTSE